MTQFTYQERFKTIKGVFDEFTNRTLFELESKGAFDELVSPLTVGKESSVFIAKKDEKKVIVKIYFIQPANFMKMFDYIRKDPRYQYLQQHRRQIILAWAQREFKNLHRAVEAGIHSPKPLQWLNHIIIEEFIGDEEPAPPLKDAPPQNPKKFYDEVVSGMTKLYQKRLIHGDLSSFNILNYREKPYFIDFSQATLTKAPNSHELLVRDVGNIVRYFQKLGVKADAEKIMIRIMGKHLKKNSPETE
ncbi:serine protein kinase RIO [Candidatus Woesearchaeota archaeon]|nr:serine protein kinase RIO [Candidatus Woesearchaeota archaeon]